MRRNLVIGIFAVLVFLSWAHAGNPCRELVSETHIHQHIQNLAQLYYKLQTEVQTGGSSTQQAHLQSELAELAKQNFAYVTEFQQAVARISKEAKVAANSPSAEKPRESDTSRPKSIDVLNPTRFLKIDTAFEDSGLDMPQIQIDPRNEIVLLRNVKINGKTKDAIYDLKDGKEIANFSDYGTHIISDTSDVVYVKSNYDVMLFDRKTRASRKLFKSYFGIAFFSPDGKKFVSESVRDSTEVLDDQGNVLLTIPFQLHRSEPVHFGAQSQFAFIQGDEQAVLLDLNAKSIIKEFDGEFSVSASRNSRFVSVTRNKIAQVYDLSTGHSIEVDRKVKGPVGLSNNGSKIVYYDIKGALQIFETNGVTATTSSFPGVMKDAEKLEMSGDGRFVALVGKSKTQILDLNTKSKLGQLVGKLTDVRFVGDSGAVMATDGQEMHFASFGPGPIRETIDGFKFELSANGNFAIVHNKKTREAHLYQVINKLELERRK